jgi:hypothetical protein
MKPGDVVLRHFLGCDHSHCSCDFCGDERLGILQWQTLDSRRPGVPRTWVLKLIFSREDSWPERSLELVERV